MLDRAFRLTFKNLSTFVLIAAVVALPLHVVYAATFQRVIAVSELHDDISRFPKTRQIRNVGRDQLRNARLGLLAVTLVEIAALPLVIRAARRTLEDDERGLLPTVTRSWAGALAPTHGALLRALRRHLGPLLVGLVVALVVGILIERIGTLLIEPLPDDDAWGGVALVQAAARSLAAPFLAVPWAVASLEKSPERVVTPDVY